jgi:dipeptidyl aminopeptidase/acylaminoacyl peptidase
MKISPRAVRTVLAVSLMVCAAQASGQGTLADYRRAAGLNAQLNGLVVNVAETPNWVGESNRFWYRKSVSGGNEFVLVDAATQRRRAPFDHARLATTLSRATDSSYTAMRLPFNTFTFADGERAIEFAAAQSRWRCTLTSYECTRLGPAPQGIGQRGGGGGQRAGGGPGAAEAEGPRRSPDGKWEAFIQNYNVAIRSPGGRDITLLSFDGSEGDAYALTSLSWSPDSKKLAAYRIRPGYRRLVHYVESSPTDQVQPKHTERVYAKPGDVLDVQTPVLFQVETRQAMVVPNGLFPNAYSMSRFEWRQDSRAVTFEYNQRGHQVYRIIEVDAATGAPRVVISEEPKTFFNYRQANGGQADSGRKYRFDVNDGREVIWMSERDGWSHLYMMDGATGQVKHQITKGEWVVRNVERVDEQARQIWFRASGMVPGQDPYFLHYYRINFDGTGLTALTDADGMHTVTFSPDRSYYVDSWSRVDLPPVAVLRRTSDQAVVMELEKGDATALLATGWRPPEVFVSKARDGRTDIWGVIVRPTNFDPSRRYPVVENIYAGPQGSFVPKTFSTQTGMLALAELGFIVVQMDGMGTNNRSKAFHDVAWHNLGDAGFPDRKLWHQAVAAKYPYYDISRVGVYGGSAGGQNSLGGMLFHNDFYKVAVSSVGCHDNRMDKIWWNEQWMGFPLGPQYEASSNVVHAGKLTGKLLLVVGELDTNVDPSSTLQVVNALIRAQKDFELLFIPGAGHGSGGDYGNRRRYDFFVRHLLGVTPPDWNAGTLLGDSDGIDRFGALELPELADSPPSFFDEPDPFDFWWR